MAAVANVISQQLEQREIERTSRAKEQALEAYRQLIRKVALQPPDAEYDEEDALSLGECADALGWPHGQIDSDIETLRRIPQLRELEASLPDVLAAVSETKAAHKKFVKHQQEELDKVYKAWRSAERRKEKVCEAEQQLGRLAHQKPHLLDGDRFLSETTPAPRTKARKSGE